MAISSTPRRLPYLWLLLALTPAAVSASENTVACFPTPVRVVAAAEAPAARASSLWVLTPLAAVPGASPAILPGARSVTAGEPRSLDVRLFHLVNLQPGRQDSADPFFRAVMPLGEKVAILIPAGLYAAGRLGGKIELREAGVLTAAAMVSSVIAVESLKGVFGRPRPVERLGEAHVRVVGTKAADGESFPSGHTAAAFSWATVLSELYPRGAILFYGTAASVGVGRVRLGAHYPSDVLVGALVGYLSGQLVLSNRGFIMRKETPGPGVDTTAISRTFRF